MVWFSLLSHDISGSISNVAYVPDADLVQSNPDNVWYAFTLYNVVTHRNMATAIILFFKFRASFVHLAPIMYHDLVNY